LSTINATKLNGGTVKIVDSSVFKISKTIAVADVTVEPGALRELHVSVGVFLGSKANFCVIIKWHPTQDEWLYAL